MNSKGILTPLPVDFLSKNLKTIEGSPLWYPSYLGFLAIWNALSLKSLSEAVLLAKSLNHHKPYHVENKLFLTHFRK